MGGGHDCVPSYSGRTASQTLGSQLSLIATNTERWRCESDWAQWPVSLWTRLRPAGGCVPDATPSTADTQYPNELLSCQCWLSLCSVICVALC